MRRHSMKERRLSGDRWRELTLKQIRASGIASNSSNTRAYDSDTLMFISMAEKLKEEGNRLFLRREYEDALIKFEKSIKLLPDENHEDISYVRSHMAECYMQLGIDEYPRAIQECNLALEATPNYTKALSKRARCYEALNMLDLALRDVRMVLKVEPNNLMATEIEQRLKKTFERQGSRFHETNSLDLVPLPEYIDPRASSPHSTTGLKEKVTERRRSSISFREVKKFDGKSEEYNNDSKNDIKGRFEKRKSIAMRMPEDDLDLIEEKNTEDKLVVEEKISGAENETRRMMKLVFGEDIRWAQVPLKCDIMQLREIIADRFPESKAVVVKYKDQEGDLVTITTTEDLRWAEASTKHGSVKLYIVEVNPDQDPLFRRLKRNKLRLSESEEDMGKMLKEGPGQSTCIVSDWIVQFAQFFKSYVGFDIDACIDIHEVGIKLCSEAMEDTVTSEEAQDLFSVASDKFLEMAALALFSCGNVHMSRARKRVYITDDSSRESVLEKVKASYDWAQKEFIEAGKRYEEALKIKPDFYEAVVALGQQQFEQAKLSWYYAIGTGVDLESWPSSGEVLMLYNNAEENMERGMKMWEEIQEQRLRELNKTNKIETLLQKMKLDNLFKDISEEEVEEQATNICSQIYVLWGTILYERSIMEYKLGVPVWHECLEVSVEKFELAGASATDIGVMIKNHCSNNTSLEGIGFNIDEIVQAWNEMYEAKKWQHNISSFRLEPLLRRRVSKLYHALECV